MAAARPSKASISNVIEAMKENGMEPGEIIVDGKGGFRVTQKSLIDNSQDTRGNGPKHFGSKG